MGSCPHQVSTARGGRPEWPTEMEGGGQDQVSRSSPLRLVLGEAPILVSYIGWDLGTAQGRWAPDSGLFDVK